MPGSIIFIVSLLLIMPIQIRYAFIDDISDYMLYIPVPPKT